MIESGIINVKKPAGWTSHDVVAKLRRKLHIKRVGHTGTLDPMATGVLPVCFGKATRIIEYYDADLKTYTAELQLGKRTDTLDSTGTILEEHPYEGITEASILEALEAKRGWIEQIPPKYSALKVNGRRLYEYARSGQEVEIRSRRVYIDEIRAEKIDLNSGILAVRVRCSKGTYIRTICDDIGQFLGCGAMMTSLIREQSGCFRLEDAHSMEEILECGEDELEQMILRMDQTLVHLGSARLKSAASIPFYLNGREIGAGYIERLEESRLPEHAGRDSSVYNMYRIYDPEGQFLGTSVYDPEQDLYRADKVLARI